MNACRQWLIMTFSKCCHEVTQSFSVMKKLVEMLLNLLFACADTILNACEKCFKLEVDKFVDSECFLELKIHDVLS